MKKYLYKNYYTKKINQNQNLCGFDLDYTLIKITVILYALTSVGLFINICMDTPWTTNDKIAFASIFFITLQAVVGDALFWNKYFPKLK